MNYTGFPASVKHFPFTEFPGGENAAIKERPLGSGRPVSVPNPVNPDPAVLPQNDPERTAKIMSGLKSEGNLEHLVNRTAELMGKAASSGELHPRQPLEDIIRFLSSSYSGIQMNCIISACYTQSPMAGYEPRKLFETLKQTMLYLIGV